MKMLKVIAVVAILGFTQVGFAADARVAFAEQKEQIKAAKKDAKTVAKETAAIQLDSRRDYVESFKSALQQAKEQRKKLVEETKENSRRRE